MFFQVVAKTIHLISGFTMIYAYIHVSYNGLIPPLKVNIHQQSEPQNHSKQPEQLVLP